MQRVGRRVRWASVGDYSTIRMGVGKHFLTDSHTLIRCSRVWGLVGGVSNPIVMCIVEAI